MRGFPALIALTLALLVVAGCGGSGDDQEAGGTSEPASESSTAESVSVPDAGEALIWGEGDYGVVLSHGAAFDAASWESQAERIAEEGNTVLALEETTPESITAAVEYLESERGLDDVALIGASAGADATLQALAEMPGLGDQLITLAANGAVEGLGSDPKLFIASEDDPVAGVSDELEQSAEGDENEKLILPGSAHAQAIFDGDQGEVALDAILDRLDQFSTGGTRNGGSS